MSQNHFIYETIFFFLIIVGLTLQIYLTVIFDQVNLSSIQSLVDNWKGGPIVSLFSSEDDICPTELNLLESQLWKGTVAGGRNYRGNIIRMPNNNQGFGVNAIESIPEQKITHWKKKLLCGERMAVTSYFDLILVSPEEVCPPDHKRCTGRIDSLGNHLCVPEKVLCPINAIHSYNYSHPYEVKSNYLLFEDGFYFYSNDKQGSDGQMILKDFVFSEGTPCADQSYANMTEDPHILDYYYLKTKCPFITEETVYTKLDSYSKRNFFKENNISEKLKSLPDYKEISDDINMSLFYRSYPGINKVCLEGVQDQKQILSKLLQLKKDLTKCFNWSSITVLVDIIAFVLLLTSYSAEITHVLIQKDKKPPYAKPVLMIATIFSVIFSCVLIANVSSIPKPILGLFENRDCVDATTFTLMSPLTLQLHLAKIFIWVILGVKILLTLRYGMMPAIKYAT